jgi:deoxyribodipyrimidine photolyase-related protein
MTVGIWILEDGLSPTQSSLLAVEEMVAVPTIFIEAIEPWRIRPYHCQKMVLVWSAMRHFAAELQEKGYRVTYSISDDILTPLIEWIKAEGITKILVMEPPDIPVEKTIVTIGKKIEEICHCQLEILLNNSFLWKTAEFADWARGKKKLLMEYFYRETRQRFNILMDGDIPISGQWNFDKDNRKPPKGKLKTPPTKWFVPDNITLSVIDRVCQLATEPMPKVKIFGKMDGFNWAVTRGQALEVLEFFIDVRLSDFGTYQDAMVTDEETMWHSLISPYLNIGLLSPLEVVSAAEKAYQDRNLKLNNVEGFIRQVIGWREYIYGLYRHFYKTTNGLYAEQNYFQHSRLLPDFFWNGETDMNCLYQTIQQILNTGYAHHIQRLMVLSNFALIAGLSPPAVESWFHSAFIDAYDWVMQTNVIGMGLFADGGILGSKPYAASANYINKMSDYCQNCIYDPKAKTGEKACPFNFFYWDFLARHRSKLEKQGRMGFILNNLDRIPESELAEMQTSANNWHDR